MRDWLHTGKIYFQITYSTKNLSRIHNNLPQNIRKQTGQLKKKTSTKHVKRLYQKRFAMANKAHGRCSIL